MALVDTTRPVAGIVVGERVRKDPGDLAALADSIGRLGLLHPVVIAPTGELLAGWRRLEAVKLLGQTEVAVRIANDVADLHDALEVESDENAMRKDFTPSEADAMRRAIEALEKPKAKARQGMAGHDRSAKLAERSPRPRDVAAQATGKSTETLRKAAAVIDMVSDESLPMSVRADAADAVTEMDRTGKVDGAYQRMQQAVADADPALREKSVGVAVAKMHKAVAGIVADVPPAVAAGLVEADRIDFRDELAKSAIAWFTEYRKALRGGLRLVGGGR